MYKAKFLKSDKNYFGQENESIGTFMYEIIQSDFIKMCK